MKQITVIGEITKSSPLFSRGGAFSFQVKGDYRDLMMKELKGKKVGDKLRIIIDDDTDWNSDKQRGLFHKLCEIYGKEHAQPKDDVKKMWKVRWGVRDDFESNGEKFILLKSTSVYTKQEYSSLIEGAISDCVQAGIDIDAQITEYGDESVNKYYADEKDQLDLF